MIADELLSRARKLVATHKESGINRAIADSLIISWRNLICLSRTPEVMISVVLLPIVFLSGFLLTFQGVMAHQGIDYIQYLVPIITLQAMFFTAMSSAVTLASDIKTGMLQRCRVMPISPIAMLGGLIIAYLVRAAIATAILLTFAHLYGFRFQTGILAIIGFFLLTLLFTTMSVTGYAILAFAIRKPDLVQSLVIIPYTPLLLLSTGFSPAENFPDWLQPCVRFQPVSLTADALRALVNGTELLFPLLCSLIWLIGLLIIFGFVAIQLYRQVS